MNAREHADIVREAVGNDLGDYEIQVPLESLAALLALAEQADRYQDLLRRLRQWDHMETAHDGPFWIREIDAALAASPVAGREGERT